MRGAGDVWTPLMPATKLAGHISMHSTLINQHEERVCMGAVLVQDFRYSYCLYHSPVFMDCTVAVDIGYSPHTDNLDKKH